MRAALLAALVPAALAFVSLGVFVACAQDPAADDTCAKAARVFNECGASLPILEGGECSATKKAIATCINMNASTCESLATLYQRLDTCVADLADGGDIDPTAVPTPSSIVKSDGGTRKDAGTTGSSSGETDPSEPGDAATSADSSPADASLPIDSGAPTTNTWPGLIVTGTIAQGVSRYFVTPTLDPGTYHFTITGTGDADLYVRKGAAPNTTTFDCRPFIDGTDESCDVVVTAAGAPVEVHVMLRGVATSSSFTLKGTP